MIRNSALTNNKSSFIMNPESKVKLLKEFIAPLMPGTVFSKIKERPQQNKSAVYNPDGGGREIYAKIGDSKIVGIKRAQTFR